MNVGSLFSGIGGLDLGLERAGMQIKWQCEIDPYCRAVLRHHWPDVPCYEDIHDIDGSAERVDLICGGFPCQPVSLAGKGLAQKDPRWLWPEMARVIGDLRPRYVLVENVPGLVRRGLDLVVTELAEMGYDAEWEIVSAAACGAPHPRERIFVVAYPARDGILADTRCLGCSVGRETEDVACPPGALEGNRQERQWCRNAVDDCRADVADAHGVGWNGRGTAVEETRIFTRQPDGTSGSFGGAKWLPEPNVGRVAHGVSNRLAQLRALGNAVVPQVAETVGRMILEAAA